MILILILKEDINLLLNTYRFSSVVSNVKFIDTGPTNELLVRSLQLIFDPTSVYRTNIYTTHFEYNK
jgi:hypothetical protein